MSADAEIGKRLAHRDQLRHQAVGRRGNRTGSFIAGEPLLQRLRLRADVFDLVDGDVYTIELLTDLHQEIELLVDFGRTDGDAWIELHFERRGLRLAIYR